MKNVRFDIDTFREIADSLLRNRRRTILTGFGIFWGLFMLLFLVGGGAGLKEMLSENFTGLSSNTVAVWAQNTSLPYKGFSEGRSWNLKSSDIERLRLMVPEADHICPVASMWGLVAEYEGKTSSVSMKGVSAEHVFAESTELKYGRYISDTDVRQARKVCIIGKRVYNELFPGGGNPCGKFIKIGAVQFQIIGVDFSNASFSINGNSSTAAVVPYTTIQKIYNWGDIVAMFAITAKKGVRASSLEPRLRAVIARSHDFDPKDEQALMVMSTEQIFAIVDNLFKGVNFLIWLVGIGTLLAGAIGVSNIMMVTVRERTTEIGIRRAIGATPAQILSQIMMESVSLTLVAGSAGIVFSVLLLNVLEIITKHQATFQITFWTAIIAALMLTVIGLAAGLAPAVRAMRIKPVDAMRDE
jgi:ABC-type antimicrobial peptide transport system, permease component